MALNQGNIWASGITILLQGANEPLGTTRNGGPVKYLRFVDGAGNSIVPTYEENGLTTPDGALSGAKYIIVSRAEFSDLKRRVDELEDRVAALEEP